ncbi:MAG: hypothetical protein A3D49_01260 [Candidatus Zambryskibacteria bacterium RIFCSPHIGHO2_02_FULL_43_37]|uniref:Uncharacterized protein n=1 Tax=Candidatus Zambryskibacteria bacterium RIFCSPHIGHO2_02_FULL_43_37 TaxID=1802749 RepID=A0A1G2TIJ0_9BACT|nr:MAG: hypothetical protein A2723_01640 [Candidatus Zambryskibacteria bacterium RIFCSPHIGHO2_01_FULL_52_18]OHA96489.1 MAG: hypothetical protein A3D49_01260 [Candidatus Zambryskibacteria bacterium RIFCSPHIGHO2_02_FULL_43_37]
MTKNNAERTQTLLEYSIEAAFFFGLSGFACSLYWRGELFSPSFSPAASVIIIILALVFIVIGVAETVNIIKKFNPPRPEQEEVHDPVYETEDPLDVPYS